MPEGSQTPRVIESTLRIMDRTRSDDGEKPGVASLQDGLRLRAAAHHRLEGSTPDRRFFLDQLRGDQALELAHPRVFKRTTGLSGGHKAGQG